MQRIGPPGCPRSGPALSWMPMRGPPHGWVFVFFIGPRPPTLSEGALLPASVVWAQPLAGALTSHLPKREGHAVKPRVFSGPVLVAVIGIMTGVALAATPPGDIAQRLAALEANVAALEAELAAIKSSRVMALNPYLTVDPAQHGVRIAGVNLQFVNGTG